MHHDIDLNHLRDSLREAPAEVIAMLHGRLECGRVLAHVNDPNG